MRWSKTLLASSVLAVSFGLTACKQASTGSSVKTAKALPQGTSVKGTSTETTKTTGTAAASGSEQLCYQELCEQGSELSYKVYLEKAQNPSPEMKAYYDQNISQHVKDALLADQRNKQALLEALEQKENLFDAAEIKEKQKELIVAIAYLAESTTLSSAQRDQIATHLKNFEMNNYSTILKTQGSEGYLQAVQKEADVFKAAQLEAKNIAKLNAELNTLLEAPMINSESESIRRIAAGEIFDLPGLDNVANTSETLRILKALLSGPMEKALLDLKLDHHYFVELYKSSKIKENIIDAKAQASQALGICETKYYQAVNLSPSAEAITKFKTTAETVRAAVLETLSPQDEGRKVVAAANLYFPRERNTINKVWLNDLAHKKNWNNSQVETLQKFSDGTLLTYAAVTGLTSRKNATLCDELVDLDVTDSAAQLGSAVKVSWFSVMQPEYGVSILAHELAHLNFYGSKSIENVKACLADKQGTTQHVSEDYADLIAAKVSLKLQNTVGFKQKNFGCFLASADAELSLKNLDLSGVHSSSLYRALQIALNRNESLPDSCTTLLKTKASKALNRCE